jgi:hypothetical protein
MSGQIPSAIEELKTKHFLGNLSVASDLVLSSPEVTPR